MRVETTIKLRRDTALDWTTKNPILTRGEPGFEIDTGRLKIGDGASTWSQLKYFRPEDPSEPLADLPAHVNSDLPHPVYDDGPSLNLIYENAKV